MRWLMIGFLLISGCGDTGTDPSDGADTHEVTDADDAIDTSDIADTAAETDSQTAPPAECALYVDKAGTDDAECGSITTPCATITHALSSATDGCIQIGPGTFTAASGESFPLRLNGVALRGAGHDPDDAPTIIDNASGTNTQLFDITCPEKETKAHKATIALEGESGLADLIAKAPLAMTKQFAILVLNGTADIQSVRTEGGAEGIFTASDSVVTIQNCALTQAGHAAIKPGGTSQVTIDSCVIWQNKDAVEPVCKAKTTIQNTEAFCNGNGLEALGGAHTTLIGNHVHHNENGIAARGPNAFISMRNNVVENNVHGVLMIFTELDMGTADDPGNNTIINNQYSGMMLRNVPQTTMAVGNTWTPNVDGTNEAGQFTGAVTLSVSTETCPNISFAGSIDKAIPANCTGSGTVTPDAIYQNIVLFNESCDGIPDGAMPTVILSE